MTKTDGSQMITTKELDAIAERKGVFCEIEYTAALGEFKIRPSAKPMPKGIDPIYGRVDMGGVADSSHVLRSMARASLLALPDAVRPRARAK